MVARSPGVIAGVGKAVVGMVVGWVAFLSLSSLEVSSYDNCSYAFVGELDRFNFRSPSDFSDPNFGNQVPIVLDYAIGNESCVEASNSNAYLCTNNTLCADNTENGLGGYLCNCKNGYEGNLYLSPGCTVMVTLAMEEATEVDALVRPHKSQ
ncbi:hypothetical protein RHMOL_Rhmol04G0099700 [Rhododendron molle]|uniref:Uncharacterized protein n=1 Tax=Rhododendron molle TaxID=49168 RepID=A0ACC0P173_RHOML|nr:hypothetical protein RHMOL_Rhmol04G0099700 [Rhododendron molle]